MRHRLERIALVSAARISGALYFVLGCVGGVFLAFADPAFSGWRRIALALGVPFLYGIMGAVLGGAGAWLYNVAARRLGGLEFNISRVDSVPEPDGEAAGGGDASPGTHA